MSIETKHTVTFLLLFVAVTGFGQRLNINALVDSRDNCLPSEVVFSIDSIRFNNWLSTVNGGIYTSEDFSFFWYNELGDTVESDTVSRFFRDTGEYTVGLIAQPNTNDSLRRVRDSVFVFLQRQPPRFVAKHTVYGEEYMLIPSVEILDSSRVYVYQWTIQNSVNDLFTTDSISVTTDFTDANYTVNFEDSFELDDVGEGDSVFIALRITDDERCRSVFRDTLLVERFFTVGNVFSPEIMEYFVIEPNENITANALTNQFDVVLRFELFNRYGVLQYSEEAPVIRWDGRNNSGQDLPSGVYFYVLEAISGELDEQFTRGFIHVFR